MSDPRDALRDATERYRAAQENADEARASQRDAIVTAVAAGIRQAEVARITGYTREHIRRIVRQSHAQQEEL